MTKDGIPSVNPKLDAMCDMLKAIHNLQKRITELEKENADAKEIVKKLVTCIREISKPNVELTNVDVFLKQAENFIKE